MPIVVYKNEAGQRVPSFSTIKSQWGISTRPLMIWANKQGLSGFDLSHKPEADIGTICHLMIDADVKDKDLDLTPYDKALIESARIAYGSYEEWRSRHDFQPVETELSLVSEEYQYGGTLDCIAMVDGKLSLLDWKTGKEVYEDHILQVVAYAQLWNENFPGHPLEGGYHILRIGKEIPSFDYRWYSEFPGAWDAFLHLRQLYDLQKAIKKLK